MHVVVLGSGVIGTTIAYYLARAGHQVTVLDRQPGPAMETSFANAGEVSPGYSAPWAGPGVPLKAIKWMLMHHSPLVIKPMLDPAMWRWGLAMLRNCTESAYQINKSRMVRVAEYSRDCLKQLRAETGIAYDERSQGTLQLFRTQKQLDGIGKDVAILKGFGVPFQVLDRAGYLEYEPALALVKDKFIGALRLPGDETGDCFKFTQNLAKMAEALGVSFRFGTTIAGIDHDGRRITGVRTDAGALNADHYVLALGSYSTQLLKPLGIDIPVYPVKGFSITVPITERGHGARVHDHGRDAQGRRHPSRRPHPRRRHRPAFRLRPAPRRGAAQDAGIRRQRSVPAGRRCRPRRVLDRPASDDAGWHADHRQHPLHQSDAEHRPRHARLDDGRRNRAHRRRPDFRQGTRDQRGRPWCRPLRLIPTTAVSNHKQGGPFMRVISTNEAPAAIGPYAQAIVADGWLFTSGQIPLTAAGQLAGSEIESQTEQVFDNLAAVLAAAGASLTQVVKTTVFVQDLNDFARLNAVYERRFGSHKPARSTVQVARLPRDVLVEIEVVARIAA